MDMINEIINALLVFRKEVNRLINQRVIQDPSKVVGKDNIIKSKIALASYSFDSSYKGHPGNGSISHHHGDGRTNYENC